MKRSIANSIILTCLIGLLPGQSLYTLAQTKAAPERSAGEDARSGQNPIKFALLETSSRAREGAADQATQPQGQATGANDQEEGKNGELIIAPYPVSSPALGTGLQWVAGYVFRLNREDKVTPPSYVGTVGMYTGNGSWGAAFGGSFHLKEDKYRVVAAVVDGEINWDFYGVGKLAGDRELFLPVNIKGKGFVTQALLRIAKGLYVGPRYQLRQIDAQIDFSALKPRGLPETIDELRKDIAAAVPPDLLNTRTAAIGPHLQRDTRDDQFYPTRGSVLNAGGDFFLKALGSKFDYQIYQVRFEGYRSLSERQVLAFGSIGCAAAGDRVPFYDLCLYGARNYLRGYSAGRFQDRRMWATQMEYRLRLPKLMGIGFTERFGVVGFGGVGWVGKQLGDLAFDELLPGGGGGLRFRLTKKYPINFRIDYGIGRVGHTLSMGVTEAF
jgi:Omp85 superfamily domain